MNRFIYICILLGPFLINAQEIVNIKGKILDFNDNPIENLEVVIKNSDELIIAQTYTDKNGYYYFFIEPHSYTIQILDSNSVIYSSQLIANKSTELENITLDYNIINLNEVIVTGKKQIISTTDDGFKLNIKGTKLEHIGNALDALKYAPNTSTRNGLEVLGNKNYVIIYNDKELHLGESQRLLFLASLKSVNIKNIEVIDRPDSSFSSEVAAIIKIQSYKIDGISGSLSTNFMYNDFFGNNNDVELFYGKKKYRVYGNFYNAQHKSVFKEYNNSLINNFNYDITKNGELKREEWNFAFGGDFFIDSLKTIGFLYDFVKDNDADFITHSDYIVSSTTNPNLNKIEIDNLFEHNDLEHTFTLDYNQKLDSLGSSISGSLNYFFNNYKVPFMQNYKEIYFNGDNLLEKNEQKTNNNKNLYGIKFDWNKVFKKFNLKLGTKYTYNKNSDIFNYYENINDQLIFSPLLSNKLNYKESKVSSYSNFKYNFKKNILNLGIRFEYKKFNLNSNENIDVTNDFFNFIPTIYYKINSIYFYFTKNLTYPSYYNYNSNLVKINETEYYKGNSELQPVRTYLFQSGYTFNKKYTLTFQYGYTDNYIYKLNSDFSEGSTISMLTNGGYRNYSNLYISTPFKLFDWWETNNKIDLSYNHFYVPKISSETYAGFGMGIESSHSFFLTKDIEISLNANYNTTNYFLYLKKKANFSTNLNLNIPLFKNGILNFALNDIFNSLEGGYQYNFNDLTFKTNSRSNTRSVTIGFTYNFSRGKEIDENYKKSAIEIEKQNIKN